MTKYFQTAGRGYAYEVEFTGFRYRNRQIDSAAVEVCGDDVTFIVKWIIPENFTGGDSGGVELFFP